VSRIEEAIRLAKGAIPQTPVATASELFSSAWAEPAPESEFDSPAPPQLSISSKWREQIADGPLRDSMLAEQFRRLGATLHEARQNHSLRSVMVSSANPGDGKTMTALNLAFVLAETYGQRVLLMDADLRRPAISSMVDLPDGSGLGEALRAPSAHKLALARLTPRLTLLPAGRPMPNPIEVLVSPRMRQILDEAVAKFDWVILDAPPVGPTTDARLLGQMVGGTLFVIRAGQTQHADVQKAIDVLGRDQILGIVLNGVEATKSDAYYYATKAPRTTR
jgi:capsular exopolysaccharide synthesis family protein